MDCISGDGTNLICTWTRATPSSRAYNPMLDCVRLQSCKKVRLFLGKVTDTHQRGRIEKISSIIKQWTLHLRCMSCVRHQDDVHWSSFYLLPKFVKSLGMLFRVTYILTSVEDLGFPCPRWTLPSYINNTRTKWCYFSFYEHIFVFSWKVCTASL